MAQYSKELITELTPVGMYRIKWTGGGELPAQLMGVYTHKQLAENAILAFMSKKTSEQKSKRGATSSN